MTPVNRMPATHLNYFYVLDDAPRPERRLLLRGGWKNEDALWTYRLAWHLSASAPSPPLAFTKK